MLSEYTIKCYTLKFGDLFEIKIIKAYKKPFTRNVEEGTFTANHDGEILNSKSEWHQPQIVRTKNNNHTRRCRPVPGGGSEQYQHLACQDTGAGNSTE